VIRCIVFDVIGRACLGWRKGVTMGVKGAICHWREGEDDTAQKQTRGVIWGSLTTLINSKVVQATRDTHSEANTNANGMNKALSGPFLVSRTGDVGSTKRRVKVPK